MRYFSVISLFLNFSLCFGSLQALQQAEMEEYRELCKRAVQDPKTYSMLRRYPIHQKLIEPFSRSNLSGYRIQIDRESLHPQLFYTQLAKWDNKIKGPRGQFSNILSPLALRNGQIIIELEKEFGPLNSLRILQIGAGFGHLPACLAEITGFESYTLLDLPECLALQKKFLSDVPNITYLTPTELSSLDEYDLVLCAFPFTEWGDDFLRETLFQKISRIPRGYLTCHAPWDPSQPDDHTEENLLLALARAGHLVYCAPERGYPSLNPLHSVIRWGTKETQAPDLQTPLPSRCQQLASAVVSGHDGGRLGDKLFCHAHVKWISHHYHIPMLIKPFAYADGFALSRLYPYLGLGFRYAREIHPKSHHNMLEALSKPSTLFSIDFFSETDFESCRYPNTGAYFYTNWRDRGFLKALREDFRPIVAIEKPILDDSDIHVAAHVRLGGGFDDTNVLQTNPLFALKSPRHSFFIEQIERIATFFPTQTIQVHLFTDDPNPQDLAAMYASTLNNPRLHFTYRMTENGHNIHVLDDFFAISAYDCLIHPQSYFSFTASLLGDFAIRIAPVHATWKKNQWVMDQIECTLDGTHPLFQRTP